MPADGHDALLRASAPGFAEVILTTIGREYPNALRHTMTGPDDRPRPRELHPAFYGCYDWHSCVEMHWALARLARLLPDQVPLAEVRAAFDQHLSAEAVAAEAGYLAAHPMFERPYGWGWALTLVHELNTWADETANERVGETADERALRQAGPAGGTAGGTDARRWAAHLAPLGEVVTAGYLTWLPKATYPERVGTHGNSAFGLARALPFARARADAGDSALLEALAGAAHRWFGADRDYPGRWEPSGSDFLSPALVEAELMSGVLPPEEFAGWLDGFLPGLADGRPKPLFTPATVSDETDGLIGHLHGLNLSRAWAWHRLAGALPAGDPRIPTMRAASDRHAAASLDRVTGTDYLVEHWLAAYAVLLLLT